MPDPCRKYRYESREAAVAGAAAVGRRTGTRVEALHAYRCDSCTVCSGRKKAWHFGHRIGTKRKPKRVRR